MSQLIDSFTIARVLMESTAVLGDILKIISQIFMVVCGVSAPKFLGVSSYFLVQSPYLWIS